MGKKEQYGTYKVELGKSDTIVNCSRNIRQKSYQNFQASCLRYFLAVF